MSNSTESLVPDVSQDKRKPRTELGAGEFSVGILIGSGIAFSWLLSTQTAKSSVQHKGFAAPFFIMWYTTLFNIVIYPVYLAGVLCKTFLSKTIQKSNETTTSRSSTLSASVSLTTCSTTATDEVGIATHQTNNVSLDSNSESISKETPEPSLKRLLQLACGLYPVWAVANYAYIKALEFSSATDVAAIFASSSVIVYLMEISLMKARFSIAKTMGTILAVGGVVCICYSNVAGASKKSSRDDHNSFDPVCGNHESTNQTEESRVWIGLCLSGLSALSAAFYKILFKIRLDCPSVKTVSLYLSLVGIMDIFFISIVIIFHYSKVEYIIWQCIPWRVLTIHSLAALSFNFFVNFGIAVTYPLFVAIGTVAGIPLNLIVDRIFRNFQFGKLHYAGGSFVIISFGIMLSSVKIDNWLKKMPLLNRHKKKNSERLSIL